jgi:hypothetical protein
MKQVYVNKVWTNCCQFAAYLKFVCVLHHISKLYYSWKQYANLTWTSFLCEFVERKVEFVSDTLLNNVIVVS